MKIIQAVASLLVIVLSMVCFAETEQELNLLWDISFDLTWVDVQELLLERKGIKTNYEYVKKSRLMGAHYKLLSDPEEEISMFGYKYDLEYRSYGMFTLKFNIDGGIDEYIKAVTAITASLNERYGRPDAAVIDAYSKGVSVWYANSENSVHERISVEDVENFDILEFLHNWSYASEQTELGFDVKYNNILFTSNLYNGGGSYIEVKIYDHKALIDKPVFEAHEGHNEMDTSGRDYSEDGF